MTPAKIRQLLLAIHAGKIATETDSLDAIGVSVPTLWRWVREARAQGVKIDTASSPWRVVNWAKFRKEKPN